MIQPGGRYFTKRWAVGALCGDRTMVEEVRGIRPVVIFGPGEREMALAARSKFGAWHGCAGVA